MFNLNFIVKNLIRVICAFLLCYIFYIMCWTIFYTETGNGDNVEHIHATWLISQSKVPYKDFFQHHNPLIWYVFAPFIGFIKSQMQMLDIAHFIGMLAGVITFFYVYKISSKFFASKQASIISILFLCSPYFYIYCFNFNPDTFMALCYAVGIYYLFTYIETHKMPTLVIAFLCFFLAFMFTQKVLVVLALLGIMVLYVFYKQKTPIYDILYALILPILGLGVFVAYLYSKDALNIYWLTNYVFNVEMQEYYGNFKINVVDKEVLTPSLVLASISVLLFFVRANIYFKIFSILFVSEALQRYFYFAISPYYMLPLMIYIVCINSVIIEKMLNKRVEFAFLFLSLSIYYAYITKEKYVLARGTDRTFAQYLEANLTPCDYVLSSFLGNQSIYTKDPHYYWALLGHIDVAGDALKIHPIANLTNLVEEYKPKIVFGGTYFNNYYKNRGNFVPVQKVSDEVINKYYLPTPFYDFYILKYEYRQKNCTYSKERKEWYYAN